MEESGQLQTPRKEPQYSMYRKLGGPPSRSVRGGEEKKPYEGHAAQHVLCVSACNL